MGFQNLRIRHLACMGAKGLAFVAGNDVEMGVEHGLTRRGLIKLLDQHAAGTKSGHYRARYLLNGNHYCS